MTATRTVLRLATLVVLAVGWALAARALWATEVPGGLELHRVSAREEFGAAELRRAVRHDAFLRIDYLLALAAQLAALAAVAWRAPRLARRLPGPVLVRGLALALIAFGAGWVARLPFGLAAHWWERRYGLATRGYGAWLWHRLPGPVELAVLLGAVLAAMLLALALGRRWWLAAAPAAVAIAALLVFAQPLVAGGTRPVRPPGLAAALQSLAGDIPVRVERASRRTRRANAEAIGLGPSRRIVLWDTLLDGRFRVAEVRVVTAHEVGHHARRHAWRGLAWFALFALPCAFVVARVTARRGGPADPTAIPLLLLAVACLQVAALPIAGAITRRYEAEADWLALERTRDPAAAESLFRQFSRVNVDDPDPPRWAFFALADHPTLLDRIAMARAYAAGAGSAGARTDALGRGPSRKVARLSANQSRGGPGASGRFLIPSRVAHFE